jgi:hypothetical protein
VPRTSERYIRARLAISASRYHRDEIKLEQRERASETYGLRRIRRARRERNYRT